MLRSKLQDILLLYAKSNRIDITTGADPNAVVATLDPPVWRQQRGAAIGDADGSQGLYACADAAACNERLIQTHIPIASTLNVTADITIFATVPTRGNCFTEDRTNGSVAGTGLTCGRIYLHAGYATNSANDNRTFRQGVMFEAEDGVAGKPDLPEYVMPPHNYPQGLAPTSSRVAPTLASALPARPWPRSWSCREAPTAS